MRHARATIGWFCLSLSLATLPGCGESHDAGAEGPRPGRQGVGGSGAVDGAGGGGASDGPPRVATDVPWLREGNFWMIAWTEVETVETWTEAGGNYDVGSYTLRLGDPITVDGMEMHALALDGDVEKHTPRWSHLGADGFGDVYGLASASSDPVRLYSLVDDVWSGASFFQPFEAGHDVAVDRDASIIRSSYTSTASYFEPPLTAVGYSESDTTIYQGTGCDFIPEYGTICGSGTTSGPSRNAMHFEYWDDVAGPVAMHYAQNYDDCTGTACNARHVEQRAEAWFFGDTSTGGQGIGHEPDSYLDPTPLTIGSPLFLMHGNVHRGDVPGDAVVAAPGARTEPLGTHDWYRFEVTPELENETIDIYLYWNEADVDLNVHLYTPPDDPTYGFVLLDAGHEFTTEIPFARGLWLSGQMLAGDYLVGVTRMTDAEFSTGYVLWTVSNRVPTQL